MIQQTEAYWSKLNGDFEWGPPVPDAWAIVTIDIMFSDLVKWIEQRHADYDAHFCWQPESKTGRILVALSDPKLAFFLKMALG